MPKKNNGFSPNEAQLSKLKAYSTLMRAAYTVTKRLHSYLGEYGLTLSQFGVLEALHNQGPMHQKEIGASILKSGGNITMVLGNLEKQRLITREPKRDDRRFLTVRLTDKGRKLIKTLLPIHVEQTEGVFEPLSSQEIESLSLLLKRLENRPKRPN